MISRAGQHIWRPSAKPLAAFGQAVVVLMNMWQHSILMSSQVTRVGIWMGDSFAEVSVNAGEGQHPPVRWFYAKKSFTDGLREILRDIKMQEAQKAQAMTGELVLATSRAETSLTQRRQGSEPAALMTAGFETWVRLQAPCNAAPALRAARSWFPTSPDKIFGIEERVRSDGTVEKPLVIEELENLVPKLELLKIKDVAVAFLHANRYPAHEQQAGEFLRGRGFNVTRSNELPPTLSDIERFRRAVECAFADAIIQDDVSTIRAMLIEEGLADRWVLRFWSPQGISDSSSAAAVRGGVEAALANAVPSKGLSYFFGLEEFLGFKDGSPYLLSIQPTTQVGSGAWPFPSWTRVDQGYEPGPMLFGKSHQLTALDVLFVRNRLPSGIEGFSDRIVAKSIARIFETMVTLGKNLAEPGRRAADSREIAEDLERTFIERIAMDIAFHDAKSVSVSGPFASSILPLLKSRCVGVTFSSLEFISISAAAREERRVFS